MAHLFADYYQRKYRVSCCSVLALMWLFSLFIALVLPYCIAYWTKGTIIKFNNTNRLLGQTERVLRNSERRFQRATRDQHPWHIWNKSNVQYSECDKQNVRRRLDRSSPNDFGKQKIKSKERSARKHQIRRRLNRYQA